MLEIQVPVPEEVLTICRECSRKYPNDIPKATDSAERRIKDLPEYESFIQNLVRYAIRGVIYSIRHIDTRQIKRDAGEYDSHTKVNGVSDGVVKAYQSMYEMSIAGRTLGMILGKELDGIAETEGTMENGHRKNRVFLRYIKPLVKDDQRVKDAVSDKKLRTIWRNIDTQAPAFAVAGD